MVRRVKKKKIFKKVENFENKGIIEKCVSCFLVYPLYGSLFFRFLKKKYLQDEGLDFTMGCIKRVQNTLPKNRLQCLKRFLVSTNF